MRINFTTTSKVIENFWHEKEFDCETVRCVLLLQLYVHSGECIVYELYFYRLLFERRDVVLIRENVYVRTFYVFVNFAFKKNSQEYRGKGEAGQNELVNARRENQRYRIRVYKSETRLLAVLGYGTVEEMQKDSLDK